MEYQKKRNVLVLESQFMSELFRYGNGDENGN